MVLITQVLVHISKRWWRRKKADVEEWEGEKKEVLENMLGETKHEERKGG